MRKITRNDPDLCRRLSELVDRHRETLEWVEAVELEREFLPQVLRELDAELVDG